MMLATLSTVEGPQLTMDAVEAVKLLRKLPLCDYAISFSTGGNVMHTSEEGEEPREPFFRDPRQQELFPLPKSFDELRRQVGAGGFIAVGSICGKLYRPARPRKLPYRHTLHAGR